MTELLHDVDAPSDAELISRVRGGDIAAYGELFARHVAAAKRLSRQLVRGPDADDLVSDAFAKVLSVLQGGGGPDVAFRAYLLTAVRRLHVDRIRAGSRLQTSDDMEAFDPGMPFQDTAVAAFESGAAAKAFASLPERWQLVLWHLEVEGQKPADIAPLLGMSPNSVSALAYRAREGLRQAFLTMHLNDISETDCRWVNEHLGAYVRNGLAKRESAKVRAHLDECRRCTAMYLELTEVNSNLAAIIAPLLLGAAATGYLASTGSAAGGLGLMSLFGRARDVVTANAGAATAGAVAAGVAAVATAGIVLLPSSAPDKIVGADRPLATVSTPGASGPAGPAEEGTVDKDGRDGEPDGTGVLLPEQSSVSPAAVLPSMLPTTTVVPVVAPAPDGSSSPGGDTTGTGGNSSPGGNPSSPGQDPSSSTDPGNDPSDGPSESATADPSPSDPSSSPTEPAPSPTSLPPSPTATPIPPTPPTDPPPPPDLPSPRYELSVEAATIADGKVSFALVGDPLPEVVYLRIETPPEGIEFSATGSDTCVRVDDVLARCTTTPPTSPILQPLARVMSIASGASVPLSMPFGGLPARSTDVTFALSDSPGGAALQTFTARYVVPEVPPAPDVALALPPLATTDVVHDYFVGATLSGVPDGYQGPATFTISSASGSDGPRATFGPTAGCDVSDDGLTLTCTAVSNGALTLHIDVKDNSVDTDVTISVALSEELGEVALANNTATTKLKAFRPEVNVSLMLATDPTGNAGKGSASAVVKGAPAEGATLTASFNPDYVQFTSVPSACTRDTATITCFAVLNGTMLSFEAALTDRPSTFKTETVTFSVQAAAAYLETDASDNSYPLVIERQGGGQVTVATTAGPSSEQLVRNTDMAKETGTVEEVADTVTGVLP